MLAAVKPTKEELDSRKYMNLNEFSNLLGVTPPTIILWKKQGRIRVSLKDGNRSFYSKTYAEEVRMQIIEFGRPLINQQFAQNQEEKEKR